MKVAALMLFLFLQGNEAALRARIAELEAQVKALEAKLAGQPSVQKAGVLGTWKGSTAKNTETFTTRTNEWRIHWKSSADGILSVQVHDGNTNRPLLGSSVIASKAGSDTTIIRAPAGRYYLSITSAVTDWEVTVEEIR